MGRRRINLCVEPAIPLDEFVGMVEAAGLSKREMQCLRMYLGMDGVPMRGSDIARLIGVHTSAASAFVNKAIAKIKQTPFAPEAIARYVRVRKPKYIEQFRLPKMMSQKEAEKIIGSEVAVGEWENGFIRVACNDPFDELLVETGRNLSAALNALVNSNYNRARKFVFKRDNYRCTNCGSFAPFQADHIKMRSHGRRDHVDNLTTLCYECHHLRHKTRRFHSAEKVKPEDMYPNPGPYTWAEMIEQEERDEANKRNSGV